MWVCFNVFLTHDATVGPFKVSTAVFDSKKSGSVWWAVCHNVKDSDPGKKQEKTGNRNFHEINDSDIALLLFDEERQSL